MAWTEGSQSCIVAWVVRTEYNTPQIALLLRKLNKFSENLGRASEFVFVPEVQSLLRWKGFL